ncbi:MAG TPA: arginine--tRNA ligase [Flavobacteriaceae bacterium]|nr:arginine--tRNA ligase [Flavobacteriaceae bacterium]
MNIEKLVSDHIKQGLKQEYDVDLDKVEFQATRKDFEGDITVVVFPILRHIKANPVAIGEFLGNHLVAQLPQVEKFNVVQGFLNLVLSDNYYLDFFTNTKDFGAFGLESNTKAPIIVEYSSPNTNKPLHLGHIRNNLLGYSVSEILKAAGHPVHKTQIINDRGIHICKSMIAWQRFGDGETPESSKMKGDHLVGKYYVKFDEIYKEQIKELVDHGMSEDDAKQQAEIIQAAQEMLRKWEANDEEVLSLWKKMNTWVYEGFDATYDALGVDFDSLLYESDTYLLGRDIVEKGIESGVFYRREDGSVWCDLTEDGLDEKIVLRADGTSVYMTQDIGTAIKRIEDHPETEGMIYTVGNEQNYHFKVLFLILKKLGYEWAENLYHLSYGMVDLPSGRMKSREGTVVDADDLIAEMEQAARTISEELGKLEGLTEQDKNELYHTIGMGALKYFILKVDPKRGMVFNPEESVDFQGDTGPFIQYTHARIQSIARRAAEEGVKETWNSSVIRLHEKEKELLKIMQGFPEAIQQAAKQHSPALIANYTYELVREFNSFYQNVSILGVEDEELKSFRVALSKAVASIIKTAFKLLGIEVPDRM